MFALLFINASRSCLRARSNAVVVFEVPLHEQVKEPRTMLAYKFKANAGGTIDLINAFRAAGLPCSGYVNSSCYLPV